MRETHFVVRKLVSLRDSITISTGLCHGQSIWNAFRYLDRNKLASSPVPTAIDGSRCALIRPIQRRRCLAPKNLVTRGRLVILKSRQGH